MFLANLIRQSNVASKKSRFYFMCLTNLFLIPLNRLISRPVFWFSSAMRGTVPCRWCQLWSQLHRDRSFCNIFSSHMGVSGNWATPAMARFWIGKIMKHQKMCFFAPLNFETNPQRFRFSSRSDWQHGWTCVRFPLRRWSYVHCATKSKQKPSETIKPL